MNRKKINAFERFPRMNVLGNQSFTLFNFYYETYYYQPLFWHAQLPHNAFWLETIEQLAKIWRLNFFAIDLMQGKKVNELALCHSPI
jgi:hypothetical protein